MRSDDAESIVRERLRVYAEETRPLVDYYSSRPTFRAVNGDQSPKDVGSALALAVEAVLASMPTSRAVSEETGA